MGLGLTSDNESSRTLGYGYLVLDGYPAAQGRHLAPTRRLDSPIPIMTDSVQGVYVKDKYQRAHAQIELPFR